jgi:hypothetical protein
MTKHARRQQQKKADVVCAQNFFRRNRTKPILQVTVILLHGNFGNRGNPVKTKLLLVKLELAPLRLPHRGTRVTG